MSKAIGRQWRSFVSEDLTHHKPGGIWRKRGFDWTAARTRSSSPQTELRLSACFSRDDGGGSEQTHGKKDWTLQQSHSRKFAGTSPRIPSPSRRKWRNTPQTSLPRLQMRPLRLDRFSFSKNLKTLDLPPRYLLRGLWNNFIVLLLENDSSAHRVFAEQWEYKGGDKSEPLFPRKHSRWLLSGTPSRTCNRPQLPLVRQIANRSDFLLTITHRCQTKWPVVPF